MSRRAHPQASRRATTGVPFSPSNLPGLVFWAHADTLSASPVSSWSYGAANLTQGTGGSQPTWSASSANVGNKPSVIYNGSKFLAATSTAALQLVGDMTVCAVMYISVTTGLQTIISKGSTGEYDAYINAAAASGAITFVRGGTAVASGTGLVPDNAKFIVTVVETGSTVAYYVNGTAHGTSTISNTASATANAVQLGQRSDAATALTGEQPEVIMYSRALSVGDLTSMHRYLGAKYGISTP